MKRYKERVEKGTVVDKGKIVGVTEGYAEVLVDGETEPDRFSIKDWAKFHGEPVVGQRIDLIALEYEERFGGYNSVGFAPEGFRPDFTK